MSFFIVFAHPRCGSSVFAKSILSQHPEIFCHDEVFNNTTATIRRLAKLGLAPFRDGTAVDVGVFVERLHDATIAATGCRNVGFEVFPGQLPRELLDHLLIERPRLILLHRANLLRAAVSHAIAVRTGEWGADREGPERFFVDPRRLVVFMAFHRAGLSDFKAMIADRGLEVLSVEFETAFKASTAAELFEHLDVSPFPDIALPATRPTDESRYRRILNIDKIDELLSGDENGFLFVSEST